MNISQMALEPLFNLLLLLQPISVDICTWVSSWAILFHRTTDHPELLRVRGRELYAC
jgi:hypothetical protein